MKFIMTFILGLCISNYCLALSYKEARTMYRDNPNRLYKPGYMSTDIAASDRQDAQQEIPKAEEAEQTGWSVYLDQDLLVGFLDLNEDRNYTMGLGAAHRGSAMKARWNLPYQAQNTIDHLWRSYDKSTGEEFHSFGYGVTAFTPMDLRALEPIEGDRPYASLVYFNSTKQQLNTPQGEAGLFFLVDEVVQTSFTIGVLGLDIGEKFQAEVHRHFAKNRIPEGWDNQISDGGELTVKYDYSKRRLIHNLSKVDFVDDRSYDVSYRYKIEGGYYTGVSFGLDARYGSIGKGFWQHDSNPLQIGNKFFNESPGFSGTKDSYAWLSATVNLVAYNALLQGQFKENEYDLKGSEIERAVAELSVGYTKEIGDHSWTIAITSRTSEIDTTNEFDRNHSWGGIYYSRRIGE